jgi:hypothetical protein
MIGQSNDQILAVGGALVAKRSIYRKMYCIVLMYPIIFVASFIWTSCVSLRMFEIFLITDCMCADTMHTLLYTQT